MQFYLPSPQTSGILPPEPPNFQLSKYFQQLYSGSSEVPEVSFCTYGMRSIKISKLQDTFLVGPSLEYSTISSDDVGEESS
jgi:hypothetical protein